MSNYNRSQIKWGIILIGLGILFLLSTMGVIRNFNWRALLHFWPVIIIIIGLNIILKKTPLWWLTPVIFVLGIIALFFISSSPGYYSYDYSYNYDFGFNPPFVERDLNRHQTETELESGIEEMKVELNFSAGRLTLDTVRDERNLYEANLKTRHDRPAIDYSYDEGEGTASLVIKQPERRERLFNVSGRNDWKIYLSSKIPLDIKVNAGAGEFRFDLEELRIKDLTINSGAGDLDINLGTFTRNLTLNSGAANIDLNIPDGKAVRLKTDGIISNNNFTNKGLVKQNNNLYQTPDYEESEDGLYIQINTPASNIDLDFYRAN
ncbi:MAG: toast rack family protein [Halanaerobiales bacterium]